MKKLFQIGLLLWLAANANAQENSAQNAPKVLHTYDWKDLNVQSTNCQIQIVSMDGMSVLKIENTNRSRLELPLIIITNALLIQKTTLISDEIKYVSVVGDYDKTPLGGNVVSFGPWRHGELRLLKISPSIVVGGDEVTNRFKADSDLDGTSNWERFQIKIPKTTNQSIKMELRIFLPSIGTVFLRPIKLLGTAESSNWWTPEQSGMIGGIAGSIIGCLGGLIGLLASRGKARKLVLALVKIFIVLGIFLLLTGIVAAATKQPYAVYYPLLLMGFILTVVFSVNLPSIQRRYDELEIRRMTSLDAS
ncbi:MAG TPA: hypothetical protein VHG71_12815 [Verrucomicrobiae bacterium]|nr:hypothetical protein [Verrucomicrobiae bacterium]